MAEVVVIEHQRRKIDAAYLKPLDEDAILAAAAQTGAILTVEEHNVIGGLGTAVAEVLGRHGSAVRLSIVALPDEDLEVAVPAELLAHYGITVEGVTKQALALVRG